jgi:dTDP-4-dehydrorhamnose 3,5-epimerase
MIQSAMPASPTLEPAVCERGIGAIITDSASGKLIEGVRVAPVSLWPDDRGYFLEVARIGHGLPSNFPADTTQISAALSYPGSIKAFHFHRHQTDLWVPAMGMFQVVLVDFRQGSSTYGVRNTMYVGSLRPWQILIPPGVGHGYKVIGPEPGMLVYVTNRFYDPQDEGRVAYNDERVNYDWELQHK